MRPICFLEVESSIIDLIFQFSKTPVSVEFYHQFATATTRVEVHSFDKETEYCKMFQSREVQVKPRKIERKKKQN